MITASLLLLQIFSETYTPKEKGSCVGVTYRGWAYKAKKVSRSRLTGRFTLTMSDQIYDPGFILRQKPKPGREIELAGADIIVDSTACSCIYMTGPCVDK